jgi:hypothetical protein
VAHDLHDLAQYRKGSLHRTAGLRREQNFRPWDSVLVGRKWNERAKGVQGHTMPNTHTSDEFANRVGVEDISDHPISFALV